MTGSLDNIAAFRRVSLWGSLLRHSSGRIAARAQHLDQLSCENSALQRDGEFEAMHLGIHGVAVDGNECR
jgi:hypothetical protein